VGIKEAAVTHKISEKECLKCGICVSKCPQGAITEVVTHSGKLVVHNTSIDTAKCNDCGICEAAGDDGYFCPAEAFYKA